MKKIDQELVIAVQKNEIAVVERLISEGADIRVPDEFDNSLIWNAIHFTNPRMAKILLENGANPNTIGNSGTLPILQAKKNGQEQICALLSNFGASVHPNHEMKEPSICSIPMDVALKNKDKFLSYPSNAPKEKIRESKRRQMLASIELSCKPITDTFKVEISEDARREIFRLIDSNRYAEFFESFMGRQLRKTITKGSERKFMLEIALMANCPVEIIMYILRAGVNVNVRLGYGHTPLHWACLHGNFPLCKALVEYGARINVKNKLGCTPIVYGASPFKSTDILFFLAEHGADVNGRNKDNSCEPTPLHRAVMKGDIELAEVLIAKGANINAKDRAGETPLESIIDYAWKLPLKYQPIIDLLKAHGAIGEDLIKVPDDANDLRLTVAVEKGDASIVKYWLDQGANPSSWGKEGNWDKPLIMKACENGYIEVVNALVEAGADISDDDYDDRSVLYVAAFANQLEIVKVLLAKGANPNEQHKGPIIAAIVNNNCEMMEALLNAGADVHLQREDEFALLATPLQAAAYYGYLDPVRLLLDRGSNINALSPSYGGEGEWTALDFAEAGIERRKNDLNHVEKMKKMNKPELQPYINGLPHQTGDQHREVISLLLSRGGKYAKEMQRLSA